MYHSGVYMCTLPREIPFSFEKLMADLLTGYTTIDFCHMIFHPDNVVSLSKTY